MTTSNRLGITELAETQTNRHVIVNAAIAKLELGAMIFPCTQVQLNTPPGAPAEGATYIVGTVPTGAWAANAKKPVTYYNGAWVFLPLIEGMYADDAVANSLYRYDGAAWSVVIPKPWILYVAVLGDGSGVTDFEATVTDANVTGASVIELRLASTIDSDENEPEFTWARAMIARPASGSFALSLSFAEHHSGPLNLQYRIN